MNKNDRLKFARIQLGVSSGDFARKAGIDPRNYSSIESGKRTIGERVLRDICAAFPIDIEWILSGTGEMFKPKTTQGRNEFSPPDFQRIPLLPISSQGCSIKDFVFSDCETITSPIKGAELAMTISGDSMAPEYPSGAYVILKQIDEQAFIDWGCEYVLDTCNGSIIKKLMPSPLGENHVQCVSINPDYPSFDVNTKNIYAIYRVIMCMILK